MSSINSWQILDNWDAMFNSDFITTRVGIVLFFAFVVCLTAFLNMVFMASNVVEVLLWAEVLLIGSIFALATTACALQQPVGYTYGLFLLNATAVEAAIGMVIVLRVLYLNKSIKLDALRKVL